MKWAQRTDRGQNEGVEHLALRLQIHGTETYSIVHQFMGGNKHLTIGTME
jgi:hypothetical protein